MNNFLRYVFCTIIFSFIFFSCDPAKIVLGESFVMTDDCNTDNADVANIWANYGDSFEDAVDVHNMVIWKVQEDEISQMHDDPYVLRRADKSYDSWITFEIPYISKADIMIYTWPQNESDVFIYLSKDGIDWTEAEFDVQSYPYDDKWTKIIYNLDSIYGMRYIKIVFPEVNSEIDDWWNPYLGQITAQIGDSVAESIETDVPSELIIPRYDFSVYNLMATVVDQIGKPVDIPVTWSIVGQLPNGIFISETGELNVSYECLDETEISLVVSAITAEGETSLEKDVTVTLKSAVIGDYNNDMKLDRDDLDYAVDKYGKTSEDNEWEEIRLADIDGTGLIDIIDISYIAYMGEYGTADQEK